MNTEPKLDYSKLPQADRRRIAMSAARSQLQHAGITRTEIDRIISADDALAALDDLLRVDPDTCAAQWYDKASDNQIALFRREWRKYQRTFLDIDRGYAALEQNDLDTALDVVRSITLRILR